MLSLALIVAAVLVGAPGLRSRIGPAAAPAARLAGAAALLALAVAASPGAYELRKFVGLCLMPAGLAWLGLAALGSGLAQHGHRGPAAATGAIWVLTTLAGNAWLGGALAGWLQAPYRGIDPLAQGTFDAVVVLGGGVEVRPDGRPELTVAGDRVVLGVRLWRAGRAERLVATGPLVPVEGGGSTSYAAATAAMWEQLGVPAAAIVVVEGPRTTTDEVRALRELAVRSRWRRVGLVTSAWHLRRAMRLCARAGLEVTPLPADALRPPPRELRWLVPQEVGFWRVQAACWELLGSLAGR